MQERRKEKRLKNKNAINVTIVDDQKKPVKGKSFSNHSSDISMSGAKIKSDIYLPVDTVILIKMKLKSLEKIIPTIGKVKWNKGSLKDESYEAGVEFVDTPEESFLDIEELIRRGVDIHVNIHDDDK